MTRSPRGLCRARPAALLLLASASAVALADGSGYADFPDHRDPPPYRSLDDAVRAQYALGHAVSNTAFVAAGTANAARRDGLGPLFNAASCDACHNEGARGASPIDGAAVPAALVIQLARPGPGGEGPDPVYGHVLNTEALPGVAVEADVGVAYVAREGRYPDGTHWQLREPNYRIEHLHYGPLAKDTAIKPRIAPQLFGVGLLERVPDARLAGPADAAAPRASELGEPTPRPGRFGWQNATATIEEQTSVAMSREMGLTSPLVDHDDCSAAEVECRAAPNGGTPEVSAEFLAALVVFQDYLAVPRAPTRAADAGALFAATGCGACHRPALPIEGVAGIASIAAYTDLRLHDLGADLADRDGSGRRLPTRFRTAPLWGIGHVTRRPLALLHDGRARSVEEAVLWHGGEAHAAKARFEALDAAERARLLDWIGSL